MFNFKHLNKKRIILVVVLILAITTFVFAPLLVNAEEDNKPEKVPSLPADSFVIQVVSWIVIPVVRLLGKLTSVVIGILTTVAQYNDFINSPAVSKGWTIIRDVFNMFFILVLLVIAFSTVLKVERYSYKKLLGGFLLAAVLVNFSKLICGFIIDISQILMLTFVNAFKGIGARNFPEMLGLTDIMSWDKENLNITKAGALISLLLGLIMATIALVVITVITIILIFRIIYLWFLVLLSPAAFVANVLPNLKSYSSRWWRKFGSQVVIGPVLAFFLWLSLAVVQDTGDSGLYNTVVGPEAKTEFEKQDLNVGSTESGSPQNVLSFAIGIAMLMGSLLIAQEMGVAGGKIAGNVSGKITDVAKGASKLPFKGLKAGYRATGLEAKAIVAKEGLAEGRFGKFGDFIYRRTKAGKDHVNKRMKYKEQLRSSGVNKEEIKARMNNWDADFKKKQLEAQGETQTTKDKKNKFEKLEKEGKLYTTEGLALAKSLAENDKLDDKYYEEFGEKMGGEYIENVLRKAVEPKNVLRGMSKQKTNKDLRKNLSKKLSTSKNTETAGIFNKANLETTHNPETDKVEAKSPRSAQLLLATTPEKFSDSPLDNQKNILNKMAEAVGIGSSSKGKVYGLTEDEFNGLKEKYKKFVGLAQKKYGNNIDIKTPTEAKEENMIKLRKEVHRNKTNKKVSRMDSKEMAEFINEIDTSLEKENGEFKAKNKKSIQELLAFTPEHFSGLSSENQKKFLDKMGLAKGNGKDNEGKVYNLTPEEFDDFKDQYEKFVDLAKEKDKNVEIKDPEKLSDEAKSKIETKEKVIKKVVNEAQKDSKTSDKIEDLLESIDNNLRKGNKQKAKEKTDELRKIINPSLEKVNNEGRIKDAKGNPIDKNKTKEIIDKEFNKIHKDIDKDKKPNFNFIKKEEISNLFKEWEEIKKTKMPKEKGSLKSGKYFSKEERDALREKVEKFEENYLNEKTYSDKLRDEIRKLSHGSAILKDTLKKGTITKKFFDNNFKSFDERIRKLKDKI